MIEVWPGPAFVPVARSAVGRERVAMSAVVVDLVAREAIVCVAGRKQRSVSRNLVATRTRSSSVCADEIEPVGHVEVLKGSARPPVVRVAGEAIRRETVSVSAFVVALVTGDAVVLIRCRKTKLVPGDDVTAFALNDCMRSP